MARIGTTLTSFVLDSEPSDASGRFTGLIVDLAVACKAVAARVHRGALAGVLGRAGAHNVQGEAQQKLDVIADQLVRECLLRNGHVAAVASEEEPDLVHHQHLGAPYLVAYDPLDGSSNIDVNITVGTIFSVLRAPRDRRPEVSDFLVGGRHQVAAGYCLYGPSTQLVLTMGSGVAMFTLDPDIGEFLLTRSEVTVAPSAREFSINASNRRYWDPSVKRWFDECLLGADGPRQRNFNTRWIASLVAEVHRILTRGGVFAYPLDSKLRAQGKEGRLRLLYELAPMAMILEQAGGAASDGTQQLMDVVPHELHQRAPAFLGASEEVALLEQYHRESRLS